MAKQFRVEGNDDDRVEIERADFANLPPPFLEKMAGVCVSGFFRCIGVIKIFLRASGDSMIFYAGKFPEAARNRPQMVHRKIKTDVAIEFSISRIARITSLRAPNLAARIAIARESRRASCRVTRRVNAAPWARVAQHQTVRVEDEPAKVCFLKDRIQTGRVGTFGQPKAAWISIENIDICISPHQ